MKTLIVKIRLVASPEERSAMFRDLEDIVEEYGAKISSKEGYNDSEL